MAAAMAGRAAGVIPEPRVHPQLLAYLVRWMASHETGQIVLHVAGGKVSRFECHEYGRVDTLTKGPEGS